MRTICAVVLVFEAIVIGLAIPVAIRLGGHAPGLAAGVWGGMAVAALVLAGLQRRFGWAYYAGWVLQVALVASSFAVPMFWVLGVLFAGLWVTGVMLGRRTDAMQAAFAERQDTENTENTGAAAAEEAGAADTSASDRDRT